MRLTALWLLLALATFGLWTAPSEAQNEEPGRVTRLLEDQLSAPGRQVSIIGFEGALSSVATIERLTISDDEGIWLEADNLALDWNRAALFRGRVSVNTLGAERIAVLRAPVPSEDAIDVPNRQATPFALPELPVSIQIRDLSVDRIEIGDDFIGEPVVLTLAGEVSLEGGEGFANILANRIDGGQGQFAFAASYSNTTRVLDLDLRLEEGPDGIVATRLNIPDTPSLDLRIAGVAPIDDYAADIRLGTDGIDRVTGTFEITTRREETAADGTVSPPARDYSLDIAGDVASLMDPAYGVFFGSDVQLTADVTQEATGTISLAELAFVTEAFAIEGRVELAEDGWPDSFALDGKLISEERILLPIPGPQTYVDAGEIFMAYDRAEGDAWSGFAFIEGFERPGVSLPSLTLFGDGVITQESADDPDGLATARLEFNATDIGLDDLGLAEALGPNVAGNVTLAFNDGHALKIDDLNLSAAGLQVTGEATVDQAPDPLIDLDMTAVSGDFSRFATISGLEGLQGDGSIRIDGIVRPLSGIFDLAITAQTEDLALGIEQVDPFLAGQSTVVLEGSRDETGTYIERLEVRAPEVRADGSGSATDAALDVGLTAEIVNLSLLSPELSGPGTLQLIVAERNGETLDFDVSLEADTARIEANGTALVQEDYAFDFTATADVSDLAPFSDLAGRPLGGGARATLAGTAEPETRFFDITLDAQTLDLSIGLAQVDPLIAGPGTLSLAARRDETGIEVSRLSMTTPEVNATGSGKVGPEVREVSLNAQVSDVGLVLPDLSGPATLDLTADQDAEGRTDVDLTLTAPSSRVLVDATVGSEAEGYEVSGDVEATIASLSPFSPLVGRSLGGSVALTASGTYRPTDGSGNVTLSGRTSDLQVGIPAADRLLRGPGTIELDAARTANGQIVVNALDLDLPNLTVDASGQMAGATGSVTFSARLADIGLFVPEFSGPMTANGSATLTPAGAWQLSVDVAGGNVAGLSANISGTVGPGAAMNLAVTGQAPLGLANPFIAPRRLEGQASFNLRVGGPSVSAISGTVTLANGRLSAPSLGQSLEGIGGTVTIASGQAQVAVSAAFPLGGSVSVSGPVGLAAPFPADLDVRINNAVISDPRLFQTTLSGALRVSGPLAGGGAVTGTIDVARTEIQIPASTSGGAGELLEVSHQSAPNPVVVTLDRAGLTLDGTPASGGSGGSGGGGSGGLALDILVRAPSQIFIRGRGLDAELGGQITLGGTTSDIQPVGQFDLRRGRLSILRQRFDLTEGTIILAGDFIPVLRLVAETTASDGTQIFIVISGPASSPDFSFESSPELPEDEVIALLIFGRNLADITPLQAVQLASAVATLTGRGGTFGFSIRESLGVDDFNVTQDADGNAAVQIGAYISENIYTDVQVNSQGETTINLNLDITDNLTARGTLESTGESSVGVYFERDY